MENRNEPLKFKEWMLKEYPTNECFQQPPVELLATGYADYIKSFQPESVEEFNMEEFIQKCKDRPEESKKLSAEGFMRITGEAFLRMWFMLGCENEMCATIENDGKKYFLSFVPQEKIPFYAKHASLTRPIDNSVEFGEFILKHCQKMGDRWGTLYAGDGGKLYTTTELYSIFLNQKDKK